MENRDGPLLFELKTNPTRFVLTAEGKTYSIALSRTAAQSLYLALAPLVAGELEPELAAAITAEAAAMRESDEAFLKEMRIQ
ncbi:MAG: hypothetical protein IT158_20015 [Bryobacterales bacterium]|nr:hypothetical protein [Bryobacterales bacterium]